MRKLVLVIAAVAAFGVASQAGGAAPITVTLKAAPTTVSWGGSVTLSGVLSSQKAGQTVTIEEQACGTTAFKRLATATTTTGGAFSLVAKPTINTQYRAHEKNAISTPVSIGVKPSLVVRKLSAGKFSVKLTAATSFVGKYVLLQRLSGTRWVTVKKVTLTTVTGTAPNMVSSATVRVRIKSRLKVHVALRQSQATCYLPATSRAIRS